MLMRNDPSVIVRGCLVELSYSVKETREERTESSKMLELICAHAATALPVKPEPAEFISTPVPLVMVKVALLALVTICACTTTLSEANSTPPSPGVNPWEMPSVVEESTCQTESPSVARVVELVVSD